MASGDKDGAIFVWDLCTGQMKYMLGRHERGVRFVVYSPDGARIASSSYNAIYIWDAHTRQRLVGPFKWDTQRIFQITYSPDGTRICSCDPHTPAIYVWDAQTGKKVAGPLSVHADAAHADLNFLAAYSPDGARIISASNDSDGTVCVWDASTTRRGSCPTNGHTGSVNSVSFSPDGTHIVSGSNDETLCVWDACAGHGVVGPLKGHNNYAYTSCQLHTHPTDHTSHPVLPTEL